MLRLAAAVRYETAGSPTAATLENPVDHAFQRARRRNRDRHLVQGSYQTKHLVLCSAVGPSTASPCRQVYLRSLSHDQESTLLDALRAYARVMTLSITNELSRPDADPNCCDSCWPRTGGPGRAFRW
jgi:hypothetical protein